MKDPETLSGLHAANALRTVAARAGLAPDAPLDVVRDPAVPGANFVTGGDARYWVGLAGECLPTVDAGPPPHPSPEFRAAHARYEAAVGAVRLHHRVPVVQRLFAVPDTFVPGAFFVYDDEPEQLVRWVDAGGAVHDGYHLVDGAPVWDPGTRRVRARALGLPVDEDAPAPAP